MENQNADKVVKVQVTDKTMTLTLPDGTTKPVGAKVTETYYESGRKDCHVELGTGIGG